MKRFWIGAILICTIVSLPGCAGFPIKCAIDRSALGCQ